MAYSKDRGDAPMRRRGGRRRKKVCIFCADKNAVIDYKDVNKLKRYVSERGKILPRRITGKLCKTSACSYSSNQESKTRILNALHSRISYCHQA